MYQNITILAAREYVVVGGGKTENRTLVLLERVEETWVLLAAIKITGKGSWLHEKRESGKKRTYGAPAWSLRLV